MKPAVVLFAFLLASCGGEGSGPTDPTPPTATQPPPTSSCAPKDIQCGATVSENVTRSSCATSAGLYFNVHRLNTSTNSNVTIAVTSRNYLLTVFLVDRNGNAITGASSLPTVDTARITRSLPADTYGIVVMPQANFFGGYSISLTCG